MFASSQNSPVENLTLKVMILGGGKYLDSGQSLNEWD